MELFTLNRVYSQNFLASVVSEVFQLFIENQSAAYPFLSGNQLSIRAFFMSPHVVKFSSVGEFPFLAH